MTRLSLKPDLSYKEDGRPWYDTKMGVGIAIKTLSGFLNLKEERRLASYIRNENLNQFFIFGDYCFDTVGNCSISQLSIKKMCPDIPDVLTYEEYQEFIRKNIKLEDSSDLCFVYGQYIPSEHVYCPVCKKGWSIKNIRDVIFKRTGKYFLLTDFINKTLREVKEFYESKTDAEYSISGEPFLQNDSFIDNSSLTLIPKDDFEKTIVKNRDGWVGTEDGITDDYIIKEGDGINFNVVSYFHLGCNNIK